MLLEQHSDGWPKSGYVWQSVEWPNIGYDAAALQRIFEGVTGKAGELAGLRAGLSDEDLFDTYVKEVSSETINSFAIEGELLDPRKMGDSIIACLRHGDREAAHGTYQNIAKVMLDARKTSQKMTVERMNEWHALLFKHDRILNDVGKLRTETIRVITEKNFAITSIRFHAPNPERVRDEMTTLIEWVANTGPNGNQAGRYATPGRAALAHLWFETIHPYSDGNGRMGRALADFIAAENPIFKEAPFSLSRAIQEDKEAYYRALGAAQKTDRTRSGEIDVTPFVEWFAGAMSRGLNLATDDTRFIHRRNRFFDQHVNTLNERQDKALRLIFQGGLDRVLQGLSSKPYQRMTGASVSTATRDLRDLADKGIICALPKGGRSSAFKISIDNNADG